MNSRISVFVTEAWYRGAFWLYLLFPLAMLFRFIVFIRRACYRIGIFSRYRSRLPVVVIGNTTVGGTGKSPLVAAIVKSLRAQGYTPGIISRGYGSNLGQHSVREVLRASLVTEVGDEPLMLKRALDCRIFVSPSRALAVQALEKTDCDIVIADDGLQHYALDRDIEICVLDGERKWGNACMLPMGPLREPLARIASCDVIVVNGGGLEAINLIQEHTESLVRMALEPGLLRPVSDQSRKEIALSDWHAGKVNAVAGIGNPERFFSLLQQYGLQIKRHAFEDHHCFTEADMRFSNDLPVIMTEKDAVKCHHLALDHAWYLPVSAVLSDDLGARLINLLKTKGWFDG